MKLRMYLIADRLPGALYIMPCPRGERLTADIATYRSRDVDVVVSMLAEDEAETLGLADEGDVCEGAGMAFIHAPIHDFGLPDIQTFGPLVHKIAQMLKDGRTVAVHCRAGIGRSGMVSAGTLVALGYGAATAVEKVSAARGVSIPDTVEQGKFIAEFAQCAGREIS